MRYNRNGEQCLGSSKSASRSWSFARLRNLPPGLSCALARNAASQPCPIARCQPDHCSSSTASHHYSTVRLRNNPLHLGLCCPFLASCHGGLQLAGTGNGWQSPVADGAAPWLQPPGTTPTTYHRTTAGCTAPWLPRPSSRQDVLGGRGCGAVWLEARTQIQRNQIPARRQHERQGQLS